MILVDRCLLVNRAPFKDNTEIIFNDGINVLCGVNGRGKTTILSYIVDAIYEMAKSNYLGSFEGKENKYYRVSSSSHSIDPSKPSLVYIRFKIDDGFIDYLDVRGNITEAEYYSLVKYDNRIQYRKINSGLASSDSVKMFSCSDNDKRIKDSFLRDVLTFFPSYRYEIPGFLNTPYKTEIEINNTARFTGVLPNPIEVQHGLDDFSSWILDVVLDWEVNKRTQVLNVQNRQIEIDVTPENILWDNLCTLLKNILVSKNCRGRVRFGIGRRSRSGNRISVIHETPEGTREQISPNLSLLSSGETALLCLFGEIIRQADRLNNNISLNKITGIVLVDEIEKHLHIRLQKEILPLLFKLFPCVQFIVSSHSPFLNMGLAATPDIKIHILDLDNGGIECEPTNNEIYQNAYELFLNERNQFSEKYEKVKTTLQELVRPVVITEGKTDIKHILKAMEQLGLERQFDIIPENDQPDGDGTLKAIVQNLCKVRQNRKIIAVFDRDNPNVTKDIPDPYKDYGNNVYALRIKCPQCRVDEGRTDISIEYMYSDDEIHKVLANGCQLFFGNEFRKDSTRRHKTNNDLRLALPGGCGCDRIVENNGGQAVFDNDDINHLAKKEEFAEAVISGAINVCQQSWDNFRPTIEVINQIIAL